MGNRLDEVYEEQIAINNTEECIKKNIKIRRSESQLVIFFFFFFFHGEA